MSSWFGLTSSIMREMATSPSHWNVRRSYADIARKLGVDEETVRNRLRMMRELGVLQGWRLIVNARALGLRSSNLVLEFETPEEKEDAIPRVHWMDGVVFVQDFYGRTLQLTVFHSGSQLEKIVSAAGGRVLASWEVNLPRCDLRIRETDWRIIGLMLRNAERKLPVMARELKASGRTVRRRISLMMGSSAFFMQPIIDIRKARGITPCQLLIECSPEKKRAVDESVGSRFEQTVFKLTNSETHSIFTILCENVAETREVLRWARAQDGVKLAKTDILEEQECVYDWIEGEVARRIPAAGGRPAKRNAARPRPVRVVIRSKR